MLTQDPGDPLFMSETPRTGTVHVLKLTTFSKPPAQCDGFFSLTGASLAATRVAALARGVRGSVAVPMKRAA